MEPTASGAPPGAARSISPDGRDIPAAREGRLVVYSTGAFDTREFIKAERLQVAGRTALLRHAGGPSMPSTSPASKDDCCIELAVPTLAWQYLPDAWAVIYWSSFETAPTRDELLALAADMPAEEPRAFPTAIRLTGPLKDYRMIAVGTRTSFYDNTNLSVVRLSAKPPTAPFFAPLELDDYPSIVLTLGATDPRTAEKMGKMTCQPGSTVCATVLADGQFYLQVESIGDRSFTATELAQILKSMSAEAPADRSVWPRPPRSSRSDPAHVAARTRRHRIDSGNVRPHPAFSHRR